MNTTDDEMDYTIEKYVFLYICICMLASQQAELEEEQDFDQGEYGYSVYRVIFVPCYFHSFTLADGLTQSCICPDTFHLNVFFKYTLK